MNSVTLPVAPALPVTRDRPAATAALELGIESGRRTHHDNVGARVLRIFDSIRE